jgi:hypothetical protein
LRYCKRGVWCALAAVLVALPASAEAAETSYGWCEIQGLHGDPYYQSAILQIPHDDDAVSFHALTDEFTAFGHQSLGVPEELTASCWMYYDSISDAEYHLYLRKESIEKDEHKSIQSIGWTGSHAATKAAAEPSRSGPYLTVKTDTSLIAARKKQEALELQAQRDQAASLAKRISDTARYRADMMAKRAKFFEELRKRGSAQ